MSGNAKTRAKRSLFWFGDFRACPDIPESVKEEALEGIVYWHGPESVDPDLLQIYEIEVPREGRR